MNTITTDFLSDSSLTKTPSDLKPASKCYCVIVALLLLTNIPPANRENLEELECRQI